MGQSIPTLQDSEMASETSRRLASMIPELGEFAEVSVADQGEPFKVPAMAIHMLMSILEEIAKGKAVSVIPMDAILTTQQAANFLNVSRPYINKLIKEEKLPCHMVGSHRRVYYCDLMAYKNKEDEKRQSVLKKLTELSQEEDMGY
jgi:excisionase family DNA binding protein